MLEKYLSRNTGYTLSCLIVLLSINFTQSLVSPQREYYSYIHWDELQKSSLEFPKIGPIITSDDSSHYLLSYYSHNSDLDRVFNADIYPEISIANAGNSKVRIYGSVQLNLLKNLSIQNEFELDSDGSEDSNFRGTQRISAGSWVGYLQHSTLNWSFKNGFLSLGRGNPFFLSPNGSVFLNADIPPMEYGYWFHKRKDLRFNWGLMLSKSDGMKKFITFHRYGIKKTHWEIGFTEAVIGVYEKWSSDEIGYILPAAVLLETEENRGINANLIWVLDGKYKWNKWITYFELLVDDFALDGGSPPQVGGLLGISRKVKKVLTNIEYTRINRWTGNHCNSATSWIDHDIPIGHSMGSDAHQIKWRSIYLLHEGVSIEYTLNFIEHGEGDPISRLKEWPEDVSCDENFGYGTEKFPSSSNSYEQCSIKLKYQFKNNWLLNIEMLGESKNSPTYGMFLTYKVST